MTTATKQRKKNKRPIFSMEFWDDEAQARKQIPLSMEHVAQNTRDDGWPAKYERPRFDKETRLTTVGVRMADEVKINPKTKKRTEIWEGQSYIRVHFDASRKFPRSKRKGDSGKK